MKIAGATGDYFYAAKQSRKKGMENPVSGFPAGLCREEDKKKEEKQETCEASAPIAEKAAHYVYKPQNIREIKKLFNDTDKKYVPYSMMADEYGVIEYNGVIFQCDYQAGALCLGDMSNEKNVLTIPLSEGGCLKVNRNHIDQLGAAIGMFSPEDVNRILRAIAQDAKARQVRQELEEDSEGIGDSATKHLDDKAQAQRI